MALYMVSPPTNPHHHLHRRHSPFTQSIQAPHHPEGCISTGYRVTNGFPLGILQSETSRRVDPACSSRGMIDTEGEVLGCVLAVTGVINVHWLSRRCGKNRDLRSVCHFTPDDLDLPDILLISDSESSAVLTLSKRPLSSRCSNARCRCTKYQGTQTSRRINVFKDGVA